jgi:23S rRNA (adenine2503-C2)-methyltransferase
MKIKNVCYLPSGRIFLVEVDGYMIECTEMRDVAVDGKLHAEVRQSQDPHVIWKHLVPYEKKWLLTVSTQLGCVHDCLFCDVAQLPFKGNLSQRQIEEQIELLIINTPYVLQSDKVKIGFARMGEPSHNLDNVLGAMINLPMISFNLGKHFNWLPCFNTILPKKIMGNITPEEVLNKVIEVKEKTYTGRLHLQISCNSTDEMERQRLFGNSEVMLIEDIIKQINKTKITNRTVTLNFIVMKGIEVSVNKLKKMGLNGEKFTVKLIPLNQTLNSKDNNLETFANYNNYEDLLVMEREFKKEGIPVVVDAIAKCEEAGLCCGQLAQIFQ